MIEVYPGGTGNHFPFVEFGRWTPTAWRYTTSPTVTYDAYNSGMYVRIGQWVYFQGRLSINGLTVLGSGACGVTGLPYAVGTQEWSHGVLHVGYATGFSYSHPCGGVGINGSPTFYFTGHDTADARGAVGTISADNISSTTLIMFDGFYWMDA